ncbi:hypothetical protein [Escherichia coli]|uniref:hypothetical protein n=1 Tax=Escherichia coli TaxID=562 RepID=UPI0010801F26|nr:hypothetical protein [Escherichia coli]EHR9374856.1 hypothetical protein [Escherichia coli]MDO1548466.1 hypothetical protein [Escherichia coli]MDO1557684.1 hypothetical protein [Escherichia coli]MEC9736545.1 hypothetical protein [Escherichia coli]TGH36347.1 hypothetical protein E5S57_24290 [Escherichia coli]
MFKKTLILTALLYSFSAAAEECKIINNTGEVSFDNLRIGVLQHQTVRGKSYAVVKKNISVTANCENVSEIEISYHAKHDGISYGLNEGKGFYTLAIKSFNVNGRSAPLTYQDSNHVATYLLPNKRVAFNDTKVGDKNISLTAEVELFIDPATSVDNISSSGEFIIHSN